LAKWKICGACGESFECAAPERGCWCEAIELDLETLSALRERFTDCLCPRCLEDVESHAVSVREGQVLLQPLINDRGGSQTRSYFLRRMFVAQYRRTCHADPP
jgi:hypothetical protein